MFLINILSQFNNPPFCGEAKLCGGWSNITSLHYYIITFTRQVGHRSSLGARATDLHKDVHIRSVHDDVSEPRAAPVSVCSCSHGYITPPPAAVPVPVPAVSTLGTIFCISWSPAGHSPQADLQPLPRPGPAPSLDFPS